MSPLPQANSSEFRPEGKTFFPERSLCHAAGLCVQGRRYAAPHGLRALTAPLCAAFGTCRDERASVRPALPRRFALASSGYEQKGWGFSHRLDQAPIASKAALNSAARKRIFLLRVRSLPRDLQ